MLKFIDKSVLRHLLIIALFLWISVSIGYWAVTKYDIDDPALFGDVHQYVKMSKGEPIENIPKPWRYRVLVPYVAGKVPANLGVAERLYYHLSEKKRVALQFGVVNVLGMTAAAYFLFIFCAAINFTFYESLLAGIFYLTNFYIINFTAIPMVDSWAFATLIVGIVCILKRQYAILFILSLLSAFVKETYFLTMFYSMSIPDDNRERFKSLLCILPSAFAYAYFRFFMYPTGFGVDQSVGTFVGNIVSQMHSFERLAALIIEGGQSFGILWIFLLVYILYFRSENRIVTRNLLVVPIVLIVPFLLASNLGRIWFLAFPAVIPAAALAFARIFDKFSRSKPLAHDAN